MFYLFLKSRANARPLLIDQFKVCFSTKVQLSNATCLQQGSTSDKGVKSFFGHFQPCTLAVVSLSIDIILLTGHFVTGRVGLCKHLCTHYLQCKKERVGERERERVS